MKFKAEEPSDARMRALQGIEKYVPKWFAWTGQLKADGKPDKAPYNPATMRHGKAGDMGTAGALAEALAAAPDGGGVGVALKSADVELVCIDVDHCIRDGEWHEVAQQMRQLFGATYLELSPSGTGLRAFVLGDFPYSPKVGDSDTQSKAQVATWPDGAPIVVEVYRRQPIRFARVVGAPLEGTAGHITCDAGAGLQWLADLMTRAKAGRAGAGTGSAAPRDGASLDDLFAQLEDIRPDKDADKDADEDRAPAEIAAEVQAYIANKPRSKLAAAWAGEGDRSSADLAICAEAIRRGAAALADVVAVWHAAPAGKRAKAKREDYQRRTVEHAARAVLESPPAAWTTPRRGARSGDGDDAARMPDEAVMAAAAAAGAEFVTARGGSLAADTGNAVLLFRHDPQLRALLGFNALAQRAERLGGWQMFDAKASEEPGALQDDDVTRFCMWLRRTYGMRLDRREAALALDAAARDATFDPLRDSLLELGAVWDGAPRVRTWLRDLAMVDDEGCAAYVSAVGRAFLVSAVARALRPGCQVDASLIVEGSGGGGKSSMLRALADAVAPDLFGDAVHDVSDAVAVVEGTRGRWLVELPELAGVRRAADVEALKASLTRQREVVRLPYATMPTEFARRFIFAATTNRVDGYLSDPSGALLRRFWPVRTLATERQPMDLAALADVAAQLWGEAVHLFQNGERWHIAPEDGEAYTQWLAVRGERQEPGAFEEEVQAWLHGGAALEPEGFQLAEIAKAVGDQRTLDGDMGAQKRLADTARRCGMVQKRIGPSKQTRWFPSAELAFSAVRAQSAAKAGKAATGGA